MPATSQLVSGPGDAREIGAASERGPLDGGDGVRERDAGQAGAAMERQAPDGRESEKQGEMTRSQVTAN